MRVQDVIKAKGSDVITVPEDASIRDAAKTMRRNNIGTLVVLTPEGKIRGILSEREIVDALARCGSCALELRVCEVTMYDRGPA